MSFITIGGDQYLAKVRKSGNSLVTSIPKEVRESMNLQQGDNVHIEISEVPDHEYDKMEFLVKAGRNYRNEGKGELYHGEQKIGEIQKLVYQEAGMMRRVMPSEGPKQQVVGGVILSGALDADFVSDNTERYVKSLFEQSQLRLVILEDGEEKYELENVGLQEYLPDLKYGENLNEPCLIKKNFSGHYEVESD